MNVDFDDWYDDYDYEEVPKHHKKTVLSKREKVKKADHKHTYADCYVTYVGEDVYGKRHNLMSEAKYCTVCGKLDCNWYRNILPEKRNKNLPVFETEMWSKAIVKKGGFK